VKQNLKGFGAKERSMTMDIDVEKFKGYLKASASSSQSTAEFKWKKSEAASMEDAMTYLEAALTSAGMPAQLCVHDITGGQYQHLLDVDPEEEDLKILTTGTADVIITSRVKAKDVTPTLSEWRDFVFLAIELKKFQFMKGSTTQSDLLSYRPQAYSQVMGLDLIQTDTNRFPVVVLTNLKEYLFCWIGIEEKQRCACNYTAHSPKAAALLMSTVAIGESRKVGMNLPVPQLPPALAGLPIFQRCKLKEQSPVPVDPTADVVMASTGTPNIVSSSGTAASMVVSTSHGPPTNVLRSSRRRRGYRDDDDDDHDNNDIDDRHMLAHQAYLSALRHFDTRPDNPRFGRPLSSEAANMYV